MTDSTPLLARIADALERLSPPPIPEADPTAHPAYIWRGVQLIAAADFRAQPLDLILGVDAAKAALHENSRRLAQGLPSHDVLLWGSRGMGKSSLVKSVVADLQAQSEAIALIEVARDALATLPQLFANIRVLPRAFLIFADDLSFDGDMTDAKALRSLLEGGIEARPTNVRLAVTSNRRHLVSRNLREQDDPINPRDVVDDKLALADRFGLSLGFHNCDQATYLAIVAAYTTRYGIPYEEANALTWSVARGGRSGRVAWQFVQEAAGVAGVRLM